MRYDRPIPRLEEAIWAVIAFPIYYAILVAAWVLYVAICLRYPKWVS